MLILDCPNRSVADEVLVDVVGVGAVVQVLDLVGIVTRTNKNKQQSRKKKGYKDIAVAVFYFFC